MKHPVHFILTFCALAAAALAQVAAPPSTSQTPPGLQPLLLGGQRHLFIDEMLIARKSNVTFEVQPPRLRQQVMERGGNYPSVIDDGKEMKMYFGETTKEGRVVRVFTSNDGIAWQAPRVGEFEVNGSKDNNVVIRGTFNGSACLDPHDSDPQRRYKYFTAQNGDDKPDTKTTEGMVLYTSPDGLHFIKHEVQLLPFNADSQAVFFWDPNIEKYVCYMRGNDGDKKGGRGRKVVRAETTDPLKPWPYVPSQLPFYHGHELAYATTELPTVLVTDATDPDETDLYGAQACLYLWAHRVYLAFPTVYYHFKGERRHLSPDGKGGNQGVGEVQLAVSRDGLRWSRYRRPAYLKQGWYGEAYCGWPWMTSGMVRRGDRIYQYATLSRNAHGGQPLVKSSSRELEGVLLFEQLADRFVAAEFAYTGGTLTTEPFIFQGDRLLLNLETGATGEGRVGLLSADGKAIPGFGVEECDLLNGDFIDKIVTWKTRADVSSLAGKAVRLHLVMRGAKLFAFQFVPGAKEP